MIRKIVIGIDYNATTPLIAETGFELARAMGARIVLVHVLSDLQYYSPAAYSPVTGFEGYMDMRFPEPVAGEQLRDASFAFLNRIVTHLGDSKIATIVKDGDVATALLDAAREEEAGMIVMGAHSRGWLSTVLMGSVTERVLRHTSIPLLIIPVKNT